MGSLSLRFMQEFDMAKKRMLVFYFNAEKNVNLYFNAEINKIVKRTSIQCNNVEK